MIYKSIQTVLMFSIVFLLCIGTALAQNTGTIEGQLFDQQTQEPLISANVFIQSLNKGAATDADGNFTIENVPYGTYDLRISYIGYTTKTISVTVDQPTVNINETLTQDVSQLDDVVVTAYGVERQINQLPYAAQKVNVEQVTTSGSDNFISALSGRVSGMKVQTASGMGGSTDIVLRGYNSLTGNNQALFVVDGVPYANERFNSASVEAGFAGYDYGNTGVDINPEAIESITVLKGPSAAALYGSRASNGAIVIETKKGAPGRELVDISYNTSVGVSMVNSNTFPDYQQQYGAGYFPSFFSQDVDGDGQAESDPVARYTADASYGPKFDPDLNVYQWDAFYPGSPNFGKPTPWMAAENGPLEFFETGTNVKNSLLINGGIESGGYYSLGYTQGNTRGVLPNSSLDEYKLSFSSGYQISEKLQVNASVDYSKTEGVGRPERGYSTIMSEFRQWWQTNVDVNAQKDAYFRNNQNLSWNLVGDKSGPFYWNNPYFERYQNFASDERNRYFGHAEAQYEVLDWLSLTGRVAIDNYNQLIEERVNVSSVGVSNYFRQNETFTEYNYDLLANYNKQLNDKIIIDGVVGANIRRQYVEGISASTNGGLLVPGLYALSNSVNSILYPGETDRKLGVNGYFASFNLNYDNFLNIALTGRRDKSSSLPEGNNVYYYPSASVGFTFSEFVDADWFSLGKLRGSWSEVGNTAPAFSLQDTYQRPANFGAAGLYTLPNTKNNSTLKPEKTKSWEAGLQLGFVNNRLFLDASYYDQNTLNQILPVNVSAASGYTSKFVNAGNVENRGVEVTLRGRPMVSNDFSWEITANWSKNINTVKELAPGVDYYEFVGPQGGVSIGATDVGNKAYGAIRGSDFIYHENGQPIVGDNGYYQTTNTSDNIIGNMNPEWRGGVSNQFNYKNISFNFLVDVRWGGDVFSLDQWYGQGTGLYKITAGLNQKGNPKRDPVSEGGGVKLPGVNEDGSTNDIYADASNVLGPYGFVRNPSAAYIYDGSYVKLREVGVSYSLPQSLVGQTGILNSATISAVGRNLWIIHKNLPNADPEQTLAAGNVQGYQGGNLPATRNVTFNLKLNF